MVEDLFPNPFRMLREGLNDTSCDLNIQFTSHPRLIPALDMLKIIATDFKYYASLMLSSRAASDKLTKSPVFSISSRWIKKSCSSFKAIISSKRLSYVWPGRFNFDRDSQIFSVTGILLFATSDNATPQIQIPYQNTDTLPLHFLTLLGIFYGLMFSSRLQDFKALKNCKHLQYCK